MGVKNSLRLAALVCVCFALLVATGCSERTTEANSAQGNKNSSDGRKGGKGGGEERDEAVPVEVTALGLGRIEAVLRFSANLEAERSVKVFSEAARQVRELLVEEGDRVARGQLLARLKDDEQRTALAKVLSQLAKARREHERQTRLYGLELISQEVFNEATYELEQLELSLEEAQRELGYTEVRAPIVGTVTQRLVNLGDYATVNQHLFDLVDFDSIVARVYVPEKELVRLDTGQPARIYAPALGDREYRGEVLRLAPTVDPRSGTLKVTIAIPDNEGLRPGLYVDVELVTKVRQSALLLPKRALVYDEDQVFIYRLGDDSTVERVWIRALLEDREYVEPEDGLVAGERVVVAGQAGLKDGAKVRVLGDDAGQEVAIE
jgi:membrane fusion protein (multidrug efflux system)